MGSTNASGERSDEGTGEADDEGTRSVADHESGDWPPSPDGLPLLGNTLSLVRDPVGFYDDIASYESDVVGYTVAGTRGVVLKHPDLVEQVLVADPDRYYKGAIANDSLGSVVGSDGLVLAEGDVWARQRKLLQPAFYQERMATYADAVTGAAEATVADWDDGDVVPVRDEMQSLTLEVLADTLFGVDLDGRGAAIGDAASAILHRFDAASLSSYLPAWVPTPRNVRFRRAIGEMNVVVDELIAERRGATEGRDDLLSLLVTAGEDGDTLDDEAVRANMVTFLIAGHETSSLALTYALYLLATHPDAAARLRDELTAVYGDELATASGGSSSGDDRRPSPDKLAECEYLDHVLTETLRLYPPAYTLFREPTEPVTVAGYELPAGTHVSLPQWIVHRDERWFDDPDAFRPDRWAGGRAEELPDYAYYPFGGGPRHCIGMRFATMEAKLALATIVPQVDLTPVAADPLDLQMAITLQPGGPVRMRVDRV